MPSLQSIKIYWAEYILTLSRQCIAIYSIISFWGCTHQPESQTSSSSPVSAHTMNVQLIRRQLLSNLPSASGLEVIWDKMYVIGDDSPLLYELQTETWNQLATYPLFATEHFTSGRLPKALKPDLECLAGVTFKDKPYLLAFGSGSAPHRDTCYVVQLPANSQNTEIEVSQILLTKLYGALQADETVTGNDLLNLEAAAASNQHLYLLQRSVNEGPNALLVFAVPDFMQYIRNPAGALPPFTVVPFNLPTIEGLKAGFSGASFFDNCLFITASVENTDDAFLDGEVLGSFVGYLDLNQPTPVCYTARITHNGEPYRGKVESISIVRKTGTAQYQALAVTDNDNGESEILELLLTIE